MPTVQALETLHCRIPARNKDAVYLAAVVQRDTGGFVLVQRWGRRGAKLQGPRNGDPLYGSLSQARLAWQKKVDEQTRDGYLPCDWHIKDYGLQGMVNALGDASGLAGSYAPAGVTQKAPAPVVDLGSLGDKVWNLATQGLGIGTVAASLNLSGVDTANVLMAILPGKRTEWQKAGMPPHGATAPYKEADGTPTCRLCGTIIHSAQHITWLKANPHPFFPKFAIALDQGPTIVQCFCGFAQGHSIHVGPSVQVVGTVPVAPIPEPTDDPDLAAEAQIAEMVPPPVYVPPPPIVLPNKRRERAPRF